MLLIGAMLAVSALGFQTGLAGPRHPVLALLLFLMVSGAMVLIMDLNRPRAGLIQSRLAGVDDLGLCACGAVTRCCRRASLKRPPSIPRSPDGVKA